MSNIEQVVRTIWSLPGDAKNNIRKIVAAAWPDLPEYSTLPYAVVEEVQKATVGTGIVMTFKEHGIQKAVLAKAGTHYQDKHYAADPNVPTYMIPGGFINLSQSPGTLLTPADPVKAESPQTGAVREMEEEVVDDKGNPVLAIDPKRLKPMDTQMLHFPTGERRAVIGYMLELTPKEVAIMKAHVARLASDETYRHAVRAHTVHGKEGKPEICSIDILPLAEVAQGKHVLLHPGQLSLFKNIDTELSGHGAARG